MLRTVEKDYLHSVFSSALHSKPLAKLSILFSIYSLNFLHWYLVASFTLSWFIAHCSSFLKGFSPSPVCPHQSPMLLQIVLKEKVLKCKSDVIASLLLSAQNTFLVPQFAQRLFYIPLKLSQISHSLGILFRFSKRIKHSQFYTVSIMFHKVYSKHTIFNCILLSSWTVNSLRILYSVHICA